MASLGHVLIGAAAARFHRNNQRAIWHPLSAAVLWSGISLLPDADVIGFRLGIQYADPWGHRGATHSFVFALMVGALTWMIARLLKLAAGRAALTAVAVVASHAVLDTLTDGGLGCALLWPFSNDRFFAPWTPLPVAPIGRAFLSPEGLRIALTELALFSPFLVYASWPRRRSRERARPPATGAPL